jgi:hypothetical protein
MSRRFCTIDSHSLFSAATSICAVAPVVDVPGVPTAPGVAAAVPNCVEAVDCMRTLRVALR